MAGSCANARMVDEDLLRLARHVHALLPGHELIPARSTRAQGVACCKLHNEGLNDSSGVKVT